MSLCFKGRVPVAGLMPAEVLWCNNQKCLKLQLLKFNLRRNTDGSHHHQPPVTGGKNATSSPFLIAASKSENSWLMATSVLALVRVERQIKPR